MLIKKKLYRWVKCLTERILSSGLLSTAHGVLPAISQMLFCRCTKSSTPGHDGSKLEFHIFLLQTNKWKKKQKKTSAHKVMQLRDEYGWSGGENEDLLLTFNQASWRALIACSIPLFSTDGQYKSIPDKSMVIFRRLKTKEYTRRFITLCLWLT